ncbi:hypothetical protein Glove_166g226 [Diversispora epigaea]|uniref:Uncharacterized protein n=1 Tax=Diversispora epigaea TaxID=1348612 RepID=A0A397IX27_9GLOM|nr:hypothetical protein Glove_166g226 [Diversispora epigaea]
MKSVDIKESCLKKNWNYKRFKYGIIVIKWMLAQNLSINSDTNGLAKTWKNSTRMYTTH